MKHKILLVGAGGRESAFALRLQEDSIVFAVMNHANPTMIDCVLQSNGEYLIDNPNDPQTVLACARNWQVDYVFVSADDPLANGVIDLLLEHGIKAVGGTQAATRIEWDKVYSIKLMQDIAPEFTPFYRVVSSANEVAEAVKEFQQLGLSVVVKPQGLTGGKGVKVMPEHLADYQQVTDYANQLLQDNPQQVLLVEKLSGIEFTIMGLSDGDTIQLCPATYDYPFRHVGDTGAGTGGMGSFTTNDLRLPFLSNQDWDDCQTIMQRVVEEMKERQLLFQGVLNGGFFKTAKGIRFMEFNSRFGDPEGLAILSIIKGSFAEVIKHLWHRQLAKSPVKFINQACVIKYLVAKEYPDPSTEATVFQINQEAIEKSGLTVFFASCEKQSGNNENHYITLKKSRVLAIGALAENTALASDQINHAIEQHIQGNLDYRPDIGSAEYIDSLQSIANKLNH